MKKIILSALIISFLMPVSVFAEQTVGTQADFYIQPSYDYSGRESITAQMVKVSARAYWYFDKQWLDDLEQAKKTKVTEALDALAEEFDSHIYPVMTANFGYEWSPGIDKDTRITVLMHPMKGEAGGYFNSADEYLRVQIENSNEKEMVYLNSSYIDNSQAKSLLAHEFQHLISFNQKERIYNVTEDIWLNESRSEYTPTLLGYNDVYSGSYLEKRVKNFLSMPDDSLTEWKNLSYDYGVINLFTHYLVDHYGKNVLINSLKSSKTGINSINYALSLSGFSEDFSQVFTDWTIAVFINDCFVGPKYCYLNENLKNLKSTPLINYLPSVGRSTLSVSHTTKDWAGKWYKFVGGSGLFDFEFVIPGDTNFKIPYIVQDSSGKYSIDLMKLVITDGNKKAVISFEGFGSEIISLIIIPSLQGKTSNFSGLEPATSFSWTASTKEPENNQEDEVIQKLLGQIAQLQNQILSVQSQINALLGKGSGTGCKMISNNLYYGLKNNPEVRCLQEFLNSQGSSIYPEGLVTGNYLGLTMQAVVRFQERYRAEILTPLGLSQATGYIGSMTKMKINQLLGQ